MRHKDKIIMVLFLFLELIQQTFPARQEQNEIILSLQLWMQKQSSSVYER